MISFRLFFGGESDSRVPVITEGRFQAEGFGITADAADVPNLQPPAQVMTVLFSDICGDLSFNAAPPQMPRRITPRWWVVSSFVSIDLIFCFYTEHVLHCTGEASLKPSLTPQYSSNPLPMTCICLSVGISHHTRIP